MTELIETILAGITDGELALVVANALDVSDAVIKGDARLERVVAANGDPSTVAVFCYSGLADIGGTSRAWSAVAKIIDLRVPRRLRWVRAADEVAVYRHSYFAGRGGAFRPAKCHHISEPLPGIVVLWLEDLTRARRAPFTRDELGWILRGLGEWNARNIGFMTPAIDLAEYSIFMRWEKREWDIDAEFSRLRDIEQSPEVRSLYRGQSIELAAQLRNRMVAHNARARRLARTLCFGDLNIGNLFLSSEGPVAIDWSSLTLDPLGVDAGSVIGSATTFGGDFVAVAQNERELFEHYLAGLERGGWRGTRDDIRRGYLVHFCSYMLGTALAPVFLRQFKRERIELRFGMPWADIFVRSAEIFTLIPSYLEELDRLAS